VGGNDDLVVYSDVWVLRLGSARWIELVPTGTNTLLARQSPRLASMGGLMWLIGGVPAQVSLIGSRLVAPGTRFQLRH
jgi:hypothetical protein